VRGAATTAVTRVLLGAAVVLACAEAGGAPAPPLAPAHAGLSCRACHAGHPPTAAAVRCTSSGCHPRLKRAFRSTPHDRKYLAGGRPTCPDCHRGHPVVTGRRAVERVCGSDMARFCRPCHTAEGKGLPGNILLHRIGPEVRSGGVHAAARRRRGCANVALSCFTCHGVHDVLPVGDPGSPVNRSRVAGTCGGCHRRQAELYRRGAHGKGVAAGLTVAPTCISCHGAHGVEAVSSVHSPTGRARVVFTCADCHEDPRVVHDANLPLGIVDSYESTVHGVAYRNGIHDVATCVSCHGAHEVLPASDPRSPVSGARIGAICRRCHARVTPAMVARIRHHTGPPTPGSLLHRLRVYFPVAGTSMNPLVASGIGGIVGFLSGVFGVGGGFLMTPLLIFIGIPAAVAAATDSAQITAGATSGMISHARMGHVDFRMGLAMVAGGWPGGLIGVWMVHLLRARGSFDFALKAVYVLLLAFTGTSMFLEGLRTLRGRSARPEPGPGRLSRLFDALPLQMSFPKSGLRTSALEPAAVGFTVGILAAFLGVGGGFMLIPAMVYVIGIPTRIAVGTGLFQEVLICAFVTLRQATSNHTVDLLLAVALFVGSTIGAQLGVRANRHLRGEQIRVLLAVIILAVMAALLYQLVAAPHLLVQFARSGGNHA